MRCVTTKPPTIFIVATKIAINANMVIGLVMSDVVCNSPPITIIPLIALVTAINGVCKE